VTVEIAIGCIAVAAAIALALCYRAFRIPRPIRIEMPQNRWALLYRLSGGGLRPTLVVLHPYSGDALSTAKYSGFLQAAIARGLNLIVPNAIGHEWHDTADETGRYDEDIGFLVSLVEQLIADGTADPRRVFIAGISNGGMMAFAIVSARPDLFAGIGTISGGMPKRAFANCRLDKAMPLVMINGDADDVLPYRGGELGSRDGFFRNIAGVEETAALFARANGGEAKCEPTRTWTRDGKRIIERIDWSKNPQDIPVTVLKIIGGGHDVIGWRVPFQAFIGLPPRGPATAAAIVDKFADVSAIVDRPRSSLLPSDRPP
jgi:polyhydroxybutyrate depolymerase